MSDDLNFLWPQLLEKCPTARLGLSRGKPAVFRWHPTDTGFWPIVGDSWEGVLNEALRKLESLEASK